jgi:hypothetical protein
VGVDGGADEAQSDEELFNAAVGCVDLSFSTHRVGSFDRTALGPDMEN